MEHTLAVDVGNTKTKLALFSGNALVAKELVTNNDVRTLKQLLQKHSPTHSIISNVGEPLSEAWTTWLEANTKVMLLDAKTKVPINVAYKSKTLGVDRLALAVLAHAAFPKHNTLVVSAGTCITYDFVDGNGNYFGGSISPGLNMRLQAMHEFTARLPKVKLNPSVSLIGNTTEASMQSGALLGAAHEVNGFIQAYEQQHSGLKVILAGGDAEHLEPHLKFKIFARPNAVLEGLQRILQHNL